MVQSDDNDIVGMNSFHISINQTKNPSFNSFNVKEEDWYTVTLGKKLGLKFSKHDETIAQFFINHIKNDLALFHNFSN